MKSQKFRAGDAELTGFINDQDLCYFGLWNFESAPDETNHQKALNEFEEWARALRASKVYGPIDGSTLNNYRLRTNSFDKIPFWGEPQNSAASVNFLLDQGYAAEERYVSYEFHDRERIQNWVASFLQHVPASTFSDLKFQTIDEELWLRRGTDFCALANEVFAQNFAFQKISYEDFKKLYHGPALRVINFETSVVIINKQNELVGCAVNLVDPSQPRTLLLKTLGVIPSYRRMGATFFRLIQEIIERNQRFPNAVLCLMKEGNLPSQVLKDFASSTREYALWTKIL